LRTPKAQGGSWPFPGLGLFWTPYPGTGTSSADSRPGVEQETL